MFHGSIVALVTPMAKTGEVDYASLTRLVDIHLQAGTDGIVALGTTGESATLNTQEHEHVAKHIIKQVAGRIPVIVGVSGVATDRVIKHVQLVQQWGADACLVLTPYYVKPTQEGLYQHFKAIAKATALPIILYNVPGRTACDILPETVAKLAAISNIVSIKEATGDVERTKQIVKLCGDNIEVLSGDDATTLESMMAGAKGCISVVANIAPRRMHNMCQATLNRDIDTAKVINQHLMPLYTELFIESNPIPVKWAVSQLYGIDNTIRLPLTLLSEPAQNKLKQILKQVGSDEN